MGIQSTHPLYLEFSPDWELCRDAYRGERTIKNKATKYLPATAGHLADGMSSTESKGMISYEAYKKRAIFHEYMSNAVETMIGVMWSKPPTIKLPAAMEEMRTKATSQNESLEQLLRRINEQQLVCGRLGLLLDMPTAPVLGQTTPYIATYRTEDIINWDDGGVNNGKFNTLNLVVLNESQYIRKDNFDWDFKEKYRILVLGQIAENEAQASYKAGVFEGESSFDENLLITPSLLGKPLEHIPFVFINSKDIVPTPDDPPLLGVARLCVAIYRAEADYRQSLYLQGQDTLVVIGSSGDSEDGVRVGAGAVLNIPIGGDAKYVGVDSSGLSEQRLALENDKIQIRDKSGQLIDSRSKEKESGESLQVRVAAQTTTLNQIARSGAEGLEKILKSAATWMGLNPDEVSITPNLDFIDAEMTGKNLIDLMSAKTMGAPLAAETIHKLMQKRDLTDLSFEEEKALIDQEEII